MAKIYLICPVRGCDEYTSKALDTYVTQLESEGHEVHYPPRDVDQTDDGIGLEICETHLASMKESDEVHVWWEISSKGSHFDFGMAYALDIPITVINSYETTEYKSYGNVLKALEERHRSFVKEV